ncbi:hypothetical protein SDD30_16860 [Moorella naiadis]|uniref:hypothetical protein n=1 Tax=Moorella naiadis (nom. illeg.) TaxID=3093670 RepID=UPI003D9C8031
MQTGRRGPACAKKMGITVHYSGTVEKEKVDQITETLTDFAKAAGWEYHLVDEVIGPELESGLIIKKQDGTVDIYDSHRRGIKKRYNQGHRNPAFFTNINERVKGIVINLHPKCESFDVTWNVGRGSKAYLASYYMSAHGYWCEGHCFTKTQYAPLECHVTICKLLRFLQDHFGVKLRVDDEGGYYETGNLNKLADNMNENLAGIKKTFELLEKMLSGTGYRVITNF